MRRLFKLAAILWIASIFILSACSGNLSQIVLFEDEFDSLPVGEIAIDSAVLMTKYYMPGYAQLGSWNVASFFKDERFSGAWEIVESEDGNFLKQNSSLVNENKDLSYPYIHPMLIGGDSIWHDYKLEFDFSPALVSDQCGVIFKVQNSRSYYFYGMQGSKLLIKMVQHASFPHRPFEKILASTDYNWEAGKIYSGDISIRENKIYSLLNDSIILIAEDDTYTTGKVGILSDVPASFYSLNVKTLSSEKRKLNRVKHQKATEKALLISENPMPVLWKKIDIAGFGCERNLRFGDMNVDGETDILLGQAKIHRGKRDFAELECLTAIDTEGGILWQKGKPSSEVIMNLGDLPFQIHDLDGDGVREVIYVMDYFLYVVDGQNGRRIKRMRTPGIGNHIESIFFMDFQGKGHDSDIVLKDWENNIWVYDESLKLLWNKFANTGAYPSAADIDGNGKDEMLMGYSLFSDEGALIWDMEDEIPSPLNSSAIVRTGLPDKDSFNIVFGAGDWGALFVDLDANIKRHHAIGHVESIMQANMRDDSPGLELVSVNFWGNQGIVHFYTAEGEIYQSSNSLGGICMPVNWKGDGEEYLMFNSNPGDGGLINAYGQVVSAFPDDGHPDRNSLAFDITGDERDEIVCWNRNEIWIYTQQDNPRKGRIYKPKRNAAYNYSNYQAFVSEAAWSE